MSENATKAMMNGMFAVLLGVIISIILMSFLETANFTGLLATIFGFTPVLVAVGVLYTQMKPFM
jgi:urea transporter